MRALRLAALIGASTVALGGTTVLLLPDADGSVSTALSTSQHGHHPASVAAPSPAATEGTGENLAIPRLQFDPVALTAVLADAIAHDPTASQAPSADPSAQVTEPQLLFRGTDEDDTITAGMTACVTEGGAGPLQLQYDLREDAGTWIVERRSASGTPC